MQKPLPKKLMSSMTFGETCLSLFCFFLITTATWAQQHDSAMGAADSPQQHFQAAQTFLIAGDYEKATAEYREAIARALQQLGNLRISHEEYASGSDLLAKAVEISPNLVAAHVDLGIARFNAGDFEAAKTEIQTALTRDPQNIRALNLAGKIYFMQGNYQAAADSLQSALQLEPEFDIGYTLALADLELKKTTQASIIFDEMLASSKPSASLQALIGIAYRETGYPDQAVSHLNKSVALDSNNPRTHSALGLAYFLKGPETYAQAREQFQAANTISPGDYTSCYYLGRIAESQKNLAEAAQWFERAAIAPPSDSDVYLRLARLQFDAGHFEQTVTSLHKLLALSSQDQNSPAAAPVHELLGKALGELGQRIEADAELARAKQIRQQPEMSADKQPKTASSDQRELRSTLLQVPKGPGASSLRESEYVKQVSELLGEAYDNLGVIDARAERYSDATAEFSQAAQWNPGMQGLDWKWGLAAFRANEYDQAIPPLERQVQRTPGDSVVRETLGVCYFMTNKFAQAAAIFMPALDHLSANPGVLYAAGVSLARSGNSKDANKLFSRMLKDNPLVPQAHLLLGEAHSDLAEYPDAIAELSRALELDPNLAEAHYYKGIVHFKQGKMDDAAQEFQAELALNPKSAPALYQLAVVRLSQQQSDEAINLLNQVLQQSPTNADAHYQLGKAMLEKGNVKAAIENLEAAVQAQPKDYSYYQLSLAYRRDGRTKEAHQALQMYENLKKQPPPAATPE